jgi:hypothetical protein
MYENVPGYFQNYDVVRADTPKRSIENEKGED